LITLEPHAGTALRLLSNAGYKLAVISNQSGVAYGHFKEEELTGVKRQLEMLLREQGVKLDGFYYCPHHPLGTVSEYSVDCYCRKPLPGLLLQAAAHLDADLGASWMIGDILHDVEAGNRAGCHTIIIDNGNETEWSVGPYRIPSYRVANLEQAAISILKSEYKPATSC
jgi:D-glycero-D-manno-heptose 1,7-bisphosphate phosphatase